MDVWVDYVCPFCMLAEQAVDEAAAAAGVEVRWHPFELRPAPAPTLRPEQDYLPRIWRTAVYPMARKLGVSITLPTVSPQPYSQRAFEGFQFARDHGVARAYNDHVFRAFFQQDRDIGELDVLTAIAGEVGLPAPAFRRALERGRYADAHRTELDRARSVGIQAVPTVIVDGQRIEGVPSPAALTSALARAPRPDPSIL